MRKWFERHGWWLCPATLAWKVIDEIWSIPGRIADSQTWACWVEEIDMWPIDVSDWILIGLFLIGAAAWVLDRCARKQPTPEPVLTFPLWP